MQGFVFQKKPAEVEEVDANVKVEGGEDTPTPAIMKDVDTLTTAAEIGSLTGTVKLSKDSNSQPIQERALLAFKAFQEAVTNLETVTRRIEELTKATSERLNNGN